jgi:hypothetical protein
MFQELTAMNFRMHFATSVANLVLDTGRRSAAESTVWTCDACETDENIIKFATLALDFQDGHPTNWEGESGAIGAH